MENPLISPPRYSSRLTGRLSHKFSLTRKVTEFRFSADPVPPRFSNGPQAPQTLMAKMQQHLRDMGRNRRSQQQRTRNKFLDISPNFDMDFPSDEDEDEDDDDDDEAVSHPVNSHKTSTPRSIQGQRPSPAMSSITRSSSRRSGAGGGDDNLEAAIIASAKLSERRSTSRPDGDLSYTGSHRQPLYYGDSNRKSLLPLHLQQSFYADSPHASPLSPNSTVVRKTKRKPRRSSLRSERTLCNTTTQTSMSSMGTSPGLNGSQFSRRSSKKSSIPSAFQQTIIERAMSPIEQRRSSRSMTIRNKTPTTTFGLTKTATPRLQKSDNFVFSPQDNSLLSARSGNSSRSTLNPEPNEASPSSSRENVPPLLESLREDRSLSQSQESEDEDEEEEEVEEEVEEEMGVEQEMEEEEVEEEEESEEEADESSEEEEEDSGGKESEEESAAEVDEPLDEPFDEPLDEPVDEPVDEPLHQPLDEPVADTNDEEVSEVDEPIRPQDKTLDEPVNEPLSEEEDVETRENADHPEEPIHEHEDDVEPREETDNQPRTPVKPKRKVWSRAEKVSQEMSDMEKTPALIRPEGEVQEHRRSKRTRSRPLDNWRGQRLIYGRDSTGEGYKIVDIAKGSKQGMITRKRMPKRKVPEDEHNENVYKRRHAPDYINLSLHATGIQELLDNQDVLYDEMERKGLVTSMRDLKWKDSDISGKEVQMAIIRKDRSQGYAHGMLKLAANANKARQKTGDYSTNFTVVHGAVALQLESSPALIVKTGSFFQVPPKAYYSLRNLRRDEAFISFHVTKMN